MKKFLAFNSPNFNFMSYSKIFNIVTIILLLISIITFFIYGFNFGIDFKGGSLIEANFKQKPDLEKINKILSEFHFSDTQVQDFDQTNVMIKFSNNQDDPKYIAKTIENLKNKLSTIFNNDIEFRKIDFVGPQIGKELIQNGVIAILLSFTAILIYIAFRFEWQYGIGIIIGLIFDAFVVSGLISITQLDFDLTTIAAILTIIGYSVNDSVVIYDRIRENFRKFRKKSLYDIINLSLNETLSRTILTVVTTLIAVLALIIFGGEALKGFSIIVFSGILIGTFSSIYISSPVLMLLGVKRNNPA